MNKTAAILIAFFLGGLGVHRFMAGKNRNRHYLASHRRMLRYRLARRPDSGLHRQVYN